jgi:nitroreductase
VLSRRRVTRDFNDTPVGQEELQALAQAAIEGPTGGGRRPVRVVVVQGEAGIRRVIAFSPGIIGTPRALLVLCIDWSRAAHLRRTEGPGQPLPGSLGIDVGAAIENALLLAEAMGLGACPVMSFHRRSIATVLDLKPDWTPVALLTLGYRRQLARSHRAPWPLDAVLWIDDESWPHDG